jgi:hypothetical protein
LLASSLQAQTFIHHKDQKINEFRKKEKTGYWKLYHPQSTLVVEGQIVDNKTMTHITYTEQGKVIARQKDDHTIELLVDGKMKKYTIKRMPNEEIPDHLNSNFVMEGSKKLFSPYSIQLIDEAGKPMPGELQETFLGKLIIPPHDYGSVGKFRPNVSVNERTSQRIIVQALVDENGQIQKAEILEGNKDRAATEYQRFIRGLPRLQPQFVVGRFERSAINYSLRIAP